MHNNMQHYIHILIPNTVPLLLCGGKQFIVVTMLERHYGPCWLRGRDDDTTTIHNRNH